MPVYTEGMRKRHEQERLNRLTPEERLQKRMLEDYNNRNAEKTAETAPEDGGGFIQDFYDTVTETVNDAGEALGRGGNSLMSSIYGDDWNEKTKKNRARLAAKANNVSNKQYNDMLEKNLSARQLKNQNQYGKEGLGLNLSRLTGDNAGKNVGPAGEEIVGLGQGPDEPEARGSAYDRSEPIDPYSSYPHQREFEKMDTVVPTTETVAPETVVTPTETVEPKEEGIMSVGGGTPDRYSSYPHDREFEKMDYEEGVAGKDPEWSQEDDNEGQNAVQDEMKELTKTIIEGTPEEKEEATEFRKKIFAHLSPRETALAKEETGNYWIDPISGVAINIDMIEADGRRKSNWLMLDKLPEHARPYFMAKFGYLDAEDVDGMPIDPKLKIAEMNVQAKKLELESLEKRHGQSIDVQYAQITGKSELQAANLRWDKEKYNNLSRAQQEELQIKQYDQVRSNVDMLFKNGQYEAGMLLGQGLGIPYVMDMKGFWRSKTKTTDIDPIFGAALRGSGLEGLTKKAAGTAYYKAIGDYWKNLITPSTDPEMKSSYFQEMARTNGHRLWNELSDAERKIARNPMLHHNSIRSKLLTELMGEDKRFGTLHTNLNNARAQRNLGDRGDGTGTGTGTGTSKKGPPKPKDLSTKLDPNEKSEKLSVKSPVKGLKEKDTKYEFGSGKYTAELAGGLLGLGKWDYDQYDSFMEYRNSAEGLREINKKNLGPEKIKRKLAEAYKTGKKGFEKILAKEKKSDTPRFTTIEEAAVFYNRKSGLLGNRREGHELRNDLKYYISRNLK